MSRWFVVREGISPLSRRGAVRQIGRATCLAEDCAEKLTI
jgi:hypothetical protein